ncbi:outer membrane cobalamin receptor [Desulfobaculum xiamenense]|uniref:Outer membrane cobalamin receptor n=1 Tax=Desulfobaculum xiamenense TaxID=995050 RepID=A0A846QNG3_9BACT|nr:TonB-dependent receptor [Desulfobaculum xiamenense]NJB68727.1 outer membrane cobalamin receptor [Desulfobaculum xiamenense]
MRSRFAVACAGVCAWLAFSTAAFATEEPVFELGEVVVGGERVSGVERVSNVTEVTAAEIRAAGAKTLDEALVLVPGVHIRTSSDGTARIDMRGMRTRNVILLLNGVPMNSTFDDQFDPGFIPVENIARIKVTQGASSVLYGSGGNAGVINIITKKGGEGAHGSVTARLGDGNERCGQATFGGGRDGLSLFASGSVYDRDNYRTSDDFDSRDDALEDGGARTNSDRDRRNMFLNAMLEPEDGTSIGLALSVHQGSFGKPNVAWTGDDYVKKAKFERMDDSQGLSAQLGASHRFDIPLTVRGWVYANTLDELEKAYDNAGYEEQSKKGSYDSDTATTRVGGALQAAYDFGAPGVLTAALSAERAAWDNTTTTVPLSSKAVETSDDHAVGFWNAGLEYEVMPFDRFGIVLGAGWHGHNRNDAEDETDWSGIAGVHYDLFDQTRLRASLARKVRFPSLKELYADGGDSTLTAERTVHYELGVDQGIAAIDTDLSLSVFRIDADDFIEKINNVSTNNDTYRFTGFEIAAVNTSVENLRLRAAYTRLDSENRSDDAVMDELQFRPEHKFTLEGWYSLPYAVKAHASWMYVGRNWAFNTAGTDKTPEGGYSVVNVRVSKGFMDDALEIFAGADNLFDADYEEGYALPRPGRSLYSGVTWNF